MPGFEHGAFASRPLLTLRRERSAFARHAKAAAALPARGGAIRSAEKVKFILLRFINRTSKFT